MTLNASGPISLGGSTSGQSVNLELGQSATAQISFNDTAVRTLTGTSAGTALIMPTNFYGKSNVLDTQTVTTGAAGSASPNFDRQRGYISGSIGSISPGTSSIYGGATIEYIVWEERGGFPDPSAYVLGIVGATNSGWTSMTIGTGTNQQILLRADAIFSSGAVWEWSSADTAVNQAFGANGNVVSVVFA